MEQVIYLILNDEYQKGLKDLQSLQESLGRPLFLKECNPDQWDVDVIAASDKPLPPRSTLVHLIRSEHPSIVEYP